MDGLFLVRERVEKNTSPDSPRRPCTRKPSLAGFSPPSPDLGHAGCVEPPDTYSTPRATQTARSGIFETATSLAYARTARKRGPIVGQSWANPLFATLFVIIYSFLLLLSLLRIPKHFVRSFVLFLIVQFHRNSPKSPTLTPKLRAHGWVSESAAAAS